MEGILILKSIILSLFSPFLKSLAYKLMSTRFMSASPHSAVLLLFHWVAFVCISFPPLPPSHLAFMYVCLYG